jgi:hypothetical protein
MNTNADIDTGLMTEGLDWLDRAECRHLDAHHFFPEPGFHASIAAQDACKRCPVKSECSDYVTRVDLRYGYAAGRKLSR